MNNQDVICLMWGDRMNRAAFFARVRQAPFGGRLSQMQVQGMTALLDVKEKHFPNLPDDQLAYCFATVYHEAKAFTDYEEDGGPAYYHKMYDPEGARPAKARELGNGHPGDGVKYHGRGPSQCTGRSNYRKAGAIILSVLGIAIDFEAQPEKALVPEYGFVLLLYGMVHGSFTGKALDDYIDGDGEEDAGEFKRSRPIINGKDKAELIAGYASMFLRALKAGRVAALAGHADAPIVPDGKPLVASTTAWATVAAATTGGAAVVAGALEHAPSALEAIAQAPDAIGQAQTALLSFGPWGVALSVIFVGAATVLVERRKKAVELGI